MQDFVVKIDSKNRLVVPYRLCENIDKTTNELFLVLAKSDEFGKYIKLISEDIFEEALNPLVCDSLKTIKEKNFSKVKLAPNHRIQLSKTEVDWILGSTEKQDSREVTCLRVKNHIAVTSKKFEEILNG